MIFSMAKTKKALEKYSVKTLVVAGGGYTRLRERLATEITDVKVIPPLCLVETRRYDALR